MAFLWQRIFPMVSITLAVILLALLLLVSTSRAGDAFRGIDLKINWQNLIFINQHFIHHNCFRC